MMQIFTRLMGGAMGVMLALAAPAESGRAEAADAAPRTITVQASGYVLAAPDSAQINVGVVTKAKTAKAALAENSKLLQAVLAGIKKLGISADDIATDQFSVDPIYTHSKVSSSHSRNRIDGFRVVNNATITVRDIKMTGEVIDRATTNGANQIGQIAFVISDLETKLDGARQAAMANAIRRAKLYAAAAGAKLGAIRTISEQYHGQQPRVLHGQSRMSAMAAAPIEPGKREVGVTVHAVWLLE